MSVRLKLIVTVSLLLALSFGVGGTALISSSFQQALAAEKSAAMESYRSLRDTVSLLNNTGSYSYYVNLTDVLEELDPGQDAGWMGLLLRQDQTVLYSSGDVALLGAGQAPATEQCVCVTARGGSGWAYLASSSLQSGGQVLILEAAFDLTPAFSARDAQLRLFWILYGGAAAIGALMTRDLRKLTTAVRRISSGNLAWRSDIHSQDEFGQLSRDFDAMAGKLQENFARMESEMQRQDAFMGAFAHELKTPMTSIIGYADLLRQDSLEEEDRMGAANYIFSEGQRLEKLSFKLLELLLLEQDTPVMRDVSLNAFLADVEQTLVPMTKERGVRLICRGEPGRAVFDPDLVKSLLYNLIDNATKALGEGGTVAVEGKRISGGCQFQVVDNGRGMEEKELSKITEAFYRVDKARSRSQGGAGLGLALCKRIVELHSGNLSFQSQVGKGTCVTVTLYGKRKRRKRGEKR